MRFRLLQDSKIRPVISGVFPLFEAARANSLLERSGRWQPRSGRAGAAGGQRDNVVWLSFSELSWSRYLNPNLRCL